MTLPRVTRRGLRAIAVWHAALSVSFVAIVWLSAHPIAWAVVGAFLLLLVVLSYVRTRPKPPVAVHGGGPWAVGPRMTRLRADLERESRETGFAVAGMILPGAPGPAPGERFTVYLLSRAGRVRPVLVRFEGDPLEFELGPGGFATQGQADEWVAHRLASPREPR
jgi:hypothetical protein